jgi:hypothetical protein
MVVMVEVNRVEYGGLGGDDVGGGGDGSVKMTRTTNEAGGSRLISGSWLVEHAVTLEGDVGWRCRGRLRALPPRPACPLATRKLGAAGEEARGGHGGLRGVPKFKTQKSWSPGVSQSHGAEPAADKKRGGGALVGGLRLGRKMSQLGAGDCGRGVGGGGGGREGRGEDEVGVRVDEAYLKQGTDGKREMRWCRFLPGSDRQARLGKSRPRKGREKKKRGTIEERCLFGIGL